MGLQKRCYYVYIVCCTGTCKGRLGERLRVSRVNNKIHYKLCKKDTLLDH